MLLDVMDRVTEAFHEVSAVFGMPRDTDEQKAARATAMQKGLKACLLGVWCNVLINLGGIKDEAFVARYREQGEGMLRQSIPLADDVYDRVRHML